jgi:peptidyl-prolyl cis-trans isomerase SurA
MLIVGAVIGSPSEAHAATELVNGINAVVQDSVVTVGEVDLITMPAQEVLIRQYRGQPELYLKKLSDARNDSLEQLLERQLILCDFKATFSQPERQAIVDKEINKEVDQQVDADIRARYSGNRITLIQTLQAQGITLERFRQTIRDRIIVSWLRQKNISSELIVSPHRVEVYYLAHRDEFKMQEEVKLRMIVLKCPGPNEAPRTEQLTEDILTKVKEGATFTEMATIHSEGSQRGQGGDLGPQELSSLRTDLADTAASLQVGQHSGVLSRSEGDDYWVCQYSNSVPVAGRHYVADKKLNKESMVEERRFENASAVTNLPPPMEFYLMLVEDKRPQRFKTLTEVRDKIEKDLLAQERTNLEKQWVSKLKKKTFVRVF